MNKKQPQKTHFQRQEDREIVEQVEQWEALNKKEKIDKLMKEEQVRKKEELRTNKEVRLEYAKKLKETWKRREQKPNIWEEEQENSIIENLFHQEQNKVRTPETGAVSSNTTPRTKVDSVLCFLFTVHI